MMKILVFPCHTEEAEEIYKSLSKMIHFDLYGMDDPTSTGEMNFCGNYCGQLPLIEEPGFSDRLIEYIDRLKIDVVYPASHHHIVELAKISGKISAKIIGPEYESCQLVDRYNLKTGINEDADKYLINCLTASNGELKFHGTVKLNGENSFEDVRDSILEASADYAMHINQIFQPRGPWSIQCSIEERSRVKGFNITLGVSTSMSLTRIAGINLPALSLFDLADHDIKILHQKIYPIMHRVRNPKWQLNIEYDSIYIDLDDTLIINGRVNASLVALIFQCRNQGKTVSLITKHRYNLEETLQKFKLKELFDHIIWLKADEHKYKYMKPTGSIFIDDAFSERKEVIEKLGIPTFEVSAVECLVKWGA